MTFTTTQHTPPLLQVSTEAPRQPVSPIDCKLRRDKTQHGKLQPAHHTCHPQVAEGIWDPLPVDHMPTLLAKAFGTVPWVNLARPSAQQRGPAAGTPSHGTALCCGSTDCHHRRPQAHQSGNGKPQVPRQCHPYQYPDATW